MNDSGKSWMEAYARWVIRWRWPIVAVCLLAAAAAGLGLRNLSFTSDFRVFFGEQNPQLVVYNELENTYTKTDTILFVLQPEDRDVFTRAFLGLVEALTEEAWQIPHAIRVDSLTNFQHTEAQGDELVVGDLVSGAADLDEAQIERIRSVALEDPALANRLIAADGATTGILVTLQLPGTDHTLHLPESVGRARDMVRRLRADHPELTVGLTGIAVLSQAEVDVTKSDLGTLVPAMYLVIIVLMLVVLRSFSGTFATLLVISFSAATAAGLSAWLGMKFNTASAMAPVIILTLAIADSVHVLMTTFDEMREGRTKREALVESVRINAEPVFLTSLTTTIGFLSLNFSDSPPFHDLGNVTALGIVAAWVFSMTLLPAIVSILPLRVRQRTGRRRLVMDRFGDFVVTRRKPLLWGMTAVSLLIVAFIPRMDIDDRFVRWFGESVPFRADTDFASANLTGPYALEFSLASGEPGGIASPVYLERLEAFSDWLRAQPDVIHVNSFTDVMKRLNKSMHGDDPAWYRLPQERELAAQYLLLYEMSVPYGLDLNSQITIDKSATRLTATIDTIPTKRMRDLATRAEDWLSEHFPSQTGAEATGAAIMFVHIAERNIRTMLVGTAIAFALIAATIMLALRSVRLALISLVTNFFPVLITFGLWAIFVGQIGIIASVVTATSLGLIVDDTVHILSKYNRAKREHRLSTHDGVRFSFSHVGNALWATTLILVAGFAVLSFSSFQVNAQLGILTAMTLAIALAFDFLVLPPLLMLIDREKSCACVTCRRAQAAAA